MINEEDAIIEVIDNVLLIYSLSLNKKKKYNKTIKKMKKIRKLLKEGKNIGDLQEVGLLE